MINILLCLVSLSAGYLIPVLFTTDAYLKKDVQRQNRWLVHFFVIGSLQISLFPVLNFIGLSFLITPLSIGVLILPVLTDIDAIIKQVDYINHSLINPRIELLRQITRSALETINLY